MKKYKVGIVGAGGVTEIHFSGYANHPELVEVAALCDPNEEVLKAKADKYGVPGRFTDLQDFIQNSGVEVVIVCTPSSIRRRVVLPIIEAGLPVFVEKPFSERFAEAFEIAEAAKKHGVPLCVNQNWRYHYPFHIVKDRIAEGAIGKVVSVLFTHYAFRQDTGWRTESERNALSVMGIHWFDGIRLILGSEAAQVAAQMSSSSAIYCVGETDATVQITFQNQVFATYAQSFSSTFRRAELIVIGEKGTIVAPGVDSVNLYLKGDKTPSQTWSNKSSTAIGTVEGLKHLFAWLETGIEAPNSAQDNLKVVSLLDAAYISAKEQRIVHLKDGLLG
ncbi:MAG: oxidoreductase domain protein [Paenibacillaceae bacterium]|nr:oxidoreductase domain protein [Paenibacillaceae bacterium]